MSLSDKQPVQLSSSSSQANLLSALAESGSRLQADEDEIQEERSSTLINEGGLSSVKDLIEVVTEMENSSECISARNSQAKQSV